MIFVKPLDNNLLNKIFDNYKTIITIEDGVKKGGFGSEILEWANNNNKTRKIEIMGMDDSFIDHGKPEELHDDMGISSSKVKEKLLEILSIIQN